MRPESPSVLVGGAEAVVVRDAAYALHELGAGRLLPGAAQRELRRHVERAANNILASAPASKRGLTLAAARGVASSVARGVALGAVFDAAVATVEAGIAYRAGELDRDLALEHVGVEAATGGVAAGCGIAVAASVTALTGGLAAPAAFAIGAGTTAAAKHALYALREAS
mgnify:CR=1 FL=1